MNESARTRQLCAALQKRGAIVHALQIVVTDDGEEQQVRAQSPGWPDRWLCHPLWHGHLEFKAWNGRLTDKQRYVLKKLHLLQPYTALIVRHGKEQWSRIELWDGTELATFNMRIEFGAVGLLLALDEICNKRAVWLGNRDLYREVLRRKISSESSLYQMKCEK